MHDLDGAQTRQLIDCEAVFQAYRATQATLGRRFAGSMSWKSVGGRRYLYRKQAGRWQSLGPDSDETRQAYEAFHGGRDRLKARGTTLDAQLRAMAPVNRAMRLGRVPLTAARVIRRLDRLGMLGSGIKIIGTHALYAYERMGGVHFGQDAIATLDVDLLYDGRSAIDLIAADLPDAGLLGLLKAIDASFMASEPGSFRAVNDRGFMVDLVTPAPRQAATARPAPPRDGDLTAVEIAGLAWLESSPVIEAVAIDERGFPLQIVAPDPRAFACHKAWLADRDDRDPAKRRRDRAQAVELAAMLATRLPSLRFDDAALDALPADIRARGLAWAAAAVSAPPEDWD